MRKLRVLFLSNYCGIKTGFGGFIREVLTYLYKTGKYELFLLAGGITDKHPEFERWPWKVYGTLPPDQAQLDVLNKDPGVARAASYGCMSIDQIIAEVKPDIFIGIEDPWGVEFCKDKQWWNKIKCVIHSTIDSRPLLKAAVDLAKVCQHFYCWADFATKDFHKIGLDHVKTLRGSVNTHVYRRLPANKREELRVQHNIPKDAFCIGKLSRNQLRKSFPTVIEGYAKFKEKNPHIKNTRLLFFTHYGEGWNIMERIKEFNVNPEEVLACYKCRATGQYFVMPFKGQDLDNPKTGEKKSLVTVNIQDGLTDEQVNEWYNLLDVSIQAFTSGGQERSIQEAKLTELITLVTNYSCGEDSCVPEAHSIPLEFAPYREQGTEFIKATTSVKSIADSFKLVYDMPKAKRNAEGKLARQWVLDNFSIEKIGKEFEEIIDSTPLTTYDFQMQTVLKDVKAVVPENTDDKAWIKSLYKSILGLDVAENDEGLAHWMNHIKNGTPRKAIDQFFRKTAADENAKNEKGVDLEELLGDEPPSERVLINIPESLGDCFYVTTLLRDAREIYKGKTIYVATKPQFKDVFIPWVGTAIDHWIEWNPTFDDSMKLEGYGKNVGYFSAVLQPHFPTQRAINYLHHGQKTSKLDLKFPKVKDKILT